MANRSDTDLTLRINADASKARRELDSTRRAVGSLAGAVSAVAFTAWIKNNISAAAELEVLAQRAGTTVEEFQRFAFATRTVGLDVEKTADILQDFNDKLGEYIQNGGGELADFFDGIASQANVTSDAFRNLLSTEGLPKFFSLLERANLSQAEYTLFLEGAASDATRLIPLLRNNAEQLRALSDEADRLGLVLSENTVKQAKQFQNDLGVLGAVANSVGQKIAADLVPELNNLTRELRDPATAEAAAALAKGITSAFTSIISAAKSAYTEVRLAAQGIAAMQVGNLPMDMLTESELAGNRAAFEKMLKEPLSRARVLSNGQLFKLWDEEEIKQSLDAYEKEIKRRETLAKTPKTDQPKGSTSTQEPDPSFTAQQVAALKDLNKGLKDERDNLQELSHEQKTINALKEAKIALDTKQAKDSIAEAKRLDQDKKAAEAKEEAEKAAEQAAADHQRQAEQVAQQEADYIDSLRRQAETLGMTTEQLRAYDLRQQQITENGKKLAQVYVGIVDAFEKQQQAIENADTNAGLEADYLSAIGREAEAAMLEISTKYNSMLREFEKTGNETGKAWADKLIDVEKVKTRLDAVQSEMDKGLSAIDRAENRINVEREAGLLTQTEAQQKLLALRIQEANALEQQIPVLREIIAQGGVAGEQAQAQLDDYQTRIIEIRNTATDLQRALKDGLTSGIQEALSGLADGTMKLRDAISALGLSVADALFNTASQKLADQIWSGVSGLFNDGAKSATDTAIDTAAATATATTLANGVLSGGTAAAPTLAGGVQAGGTTAAVSLSAGVLEGAMAGSAIFSQAIITAASAAALEIAAACAMCSCNSPGTTPNSSGASGGFLGGLLGSLGGLLGGSGASGGAAAAGGASAGAGTASIGALEFPSVGAMASGGKVVGPGTDTSDSIPMWLSNEEYVVRAAAATQPGAESFLHDFNRYGMDALDRYHQATGGVAGIPAPAMPSPTLGSMQLAEQPVQSSPTTVKNAIHMHPVVSEDLISSLAWGRKGEDHFKVFLGRNRTLVNSILKR
ncbi:hypothetical protein LX59_03012 [Azomonas agilis]|uniref:Tail length tape measure protein n=1 Tax=Azomonas agilis TaxID=116849 RepID=A0A562HZK1_9GAMM|nr:hypothetical protein [Azomonas agilis]TWH63848.1 hypothetical protein LX59_03012 [Azomonas agilis]